jgi:hypothetical protein
MNQQNPRNLNRENMSQSAVFVVWCLLLYLSFLLGTSLSWESLERDYIAWTKKGSLLLAIMPVALLVLTGLFSEDMKAKLVFLRWNHALPGHRAFSELAPRDARINMQLLRDKLGNLPEDPGAQNNEWYALYRKYDNATRVEEIHKKFLLSRDLAAISLVLSFGGTVGLALAGTGFLAALMYFFLMLMHYFLFAIVAQNNGKELVCQVLVEYVVGASSGSSAS